MTPQPTTPQPPPPAATSGSSPADLATQIDNVNQAVEGASRLAAARAATAAQGGAGPGASVIKDNAGRIVVTGPGGQTIVIDPKAGLDGDQIQEMVQTALQPPAPPREDSGVPKELIPIVAIVFTFLFLIAVVISRTVSGRRAAVGSSTVALPPETSARLARIEQAVEAVAIEVERISEAQRYSAQLLTDRLPAGATERTRTSATPATRS